MDETASASESSRDVPVDETVLAKWLVWGSVSEALEAADHPGTPAWAIRRAKRDRKEPEVQAALAALGDLTDPDVLQDRAQRARVLLDVDAREVQERRQREAGERADAYVDAAIATIRETVEGGRTAYLHSLEFIGSDFGVEARQGGAPPTASALTELGWSGWEVVGTFPHTVGIPMVNVFGGQRSFGGGLGGIVDGVYVLLRYPISAPFSSQEEDRTRILVRAIYGREQVASQPMRQDLMRLEQESDRPSVGGAPPRPRSVGPAGFVGYGFAISHPIGGETVDEGGDDEGGFDFGDFDF